jgi:protein-tyrosine phosphatase
LSRVLFVCLGNICRSPLAEGIFLHQVRQRGLEARYSADSAGTGNWHVGETPDPRSITAAKKRGVHLPSLCRQVKSADFREFDVILAMDKNNRSELNALCPPELRGKIRLMRDYDAGSDRGKDVPDPYYGGPAEFDAVYQMLDRCCAAFLDASEGSGKGAKTGDAAP